ncbi:MAG: hypothetical protein P1V20_10930 [Verrucomicrobiales bacterium]|nr:hypothetical protein [Verrucomicrobiales bacterium]
MSKSKNEAKLEGIKNGVIIIRLWPKTPILYPMAILALICGIVSQIYGIPGELADAHARLDAEVRSIEKNDTEETVIPNVEEPAPTTPDSSDTTIVPAPATESTPQAEPDPAPATSNLAVSDDIDKSKSSIIQTSLALLFLAMLGFSLFVVCIDFEVRWSLLVFVVLLMIIMATLMADKLGYIELPNPLGFLDHFILYATPLFYFSVFGIWVLLMIVSAIIARFHYVRIEANEVVVMSGVLETQKRMSTFRMHYTKEIQDVFEYYLPFVRSGRLVFTFPNEEHPLIMDNVLGINKVLKQLDKSSSAFQVRGVE